MHPHAEHAAFSPDRSATTGSALDLVVDELTERFSRGESPELAEYLVRYPHLSDQLRKTYQALQALHSPEDGDFTAASSDGPSLPCGRLGDFLLVRQIGRGGMGVVYEAEQLSLRRRVALKALPFAAVLDGRQLQRFKNEAQAAASLQHPNIVDVYAVGCERGVHYYAMRYIEGQTLAQLVCEVRSLYGHDCHDVGRCDSTTSSATTLPAANSGLFDSSGGFRAYCRSIATIVLQAAEALEHAHQMGIVHRDIKPSNMMLDSCGHLWITDFGLAMFEANADLTMSGMILGTLRYMSPEQMRGDRHVLDHRTDVYSLGITFYELLALQPAFSDNDPKRLLQTIPSRDPPAIRRIRPDVPRDLVRIVSKAIAKEPADRYRTAQEFADDVQCFLEGRPIRARRRSVLDAAGKWIRRNTTAVGVCLLLLATASAGLLIGNLLISRERTKAQRAFHIVDGSYREVEEQRHRAEKALAELQSQTRYTSEVAYASDITLAAGAWYRGDPLQQTELLARHIPTKERPDLRGFEWHYLWEQTHLGPSDVIRCGEPCYCVTFSPDGNQLAVAGKAGAVQVFDTTRWEELWSLETGQGEVNGLAFHPGGAQIASAGDDGTIRIWDTAAQKLVLNIQAHNSLAFQVAYSRDGRELFSCGKEPIIRVWDPVSGSPVGVLEGHQEAVEAMAISPDGRVLGSASSDGTVALWDVRSRKRIASAATPTGRMVCCAFSHDSRLFAAGSTAGRLLVWDVGGTQLLKHRVFTRNVGDGVQTLTFAPGSTVLIAGDRGGGLRQWHFTEQNDETSASDLHWLGHRGRTYCATFSPDGRNLVSTGEDGTLNVWKGRDRRHWRPLSQLQCASFTVAGSVLFGVSLDGAIHRWNINTGAHVQLLLPESESWESIAVSRDATLMAVGNKRGDLLLWDLAQTREIRRWDFGKDIDRVVFSPDGSMLAVVCWPSDYKIHLLQVHKDGEFCTVSAKQCDALAFSPDSNRLAAGDWRDIGIFDVGTGRRLNSLPTRADTITGLAFGPSGDWVASIGSDRRLTVWDLATGSERFTTVAHAARIRVLAVSPDGRTIVTGSDDSTVKLWSVPTEQLLVAFPPDGEPGRKAMFTADGNRLLCMDRADVIRVYDGGRADGTSPCAVTDSPTRDHASSRHPTPAAGRVALPE